MQKLNIFVPLQKADASQRLVYGLMTAEVADKSGEILDYASAKPAIQKWSDGIAAGSGGKSLGNVRLMHGRVPAFGAMPIGKIVSMVFDDMAKAVQVCVKVTDDLVWKMVEDGLLTGFSIGGGYAKRWADGLLKRFTPAMAELSLVDNPCVDICTIDMIKADGLIEKIELHGRPYEPGNEAVKAFAANLAKAAGKEGAVNDYVARARADLIVAHTETGEVFAKGADGAWAMAKADDEDAAAGDDAPVEEGAEAGADDDKVEKGVDAEAAPADPVAAAQAAMDKAAAVLDPPIIITGDDVFADLSKIGPVLIALNELAAEHPLAKSLYDVQWIADLMSCFTTLQASLSWEAKAEGDGSEAPQKAADILAQMGALLVSVAKEEVAESLTQLNEMGGVTVVIPDAEVMAMAAPLMDLVKADLPLMEKVGARNSKTDASRIQTIHDHAVSLGSDCPGSAEKMAKVAQETGVLTDTLEKVTTALEKMTHRASAAAELEAAASGELAKAKARIEELEKAPAPAKGVLRMTKQVDDNGTGVVVEQPLLKDVAAAAPIGDFLTELSKIASPIERANLILHRAQVAPGGGARY